MSEFKVVERPGSSSSIPDSLVEALQATITNDKAIEIELGNGSLINWQSNVRNRLKKLDLRLKYRFDKSRRVIVAWAEPVDEEALANAEQEA